jgi:hypothetical protein
MHFIVHNADFNVQNSIMKLAVVPLLVLFITSSNFNNDLRARFGLHGLQCFLQMLTGHHQKMPAGQAFQGNIGPDALDFP